jgi:hypothetical protein
MIGKADTTSKVNWIYKQGLQDSTNRDIYVNAVYFTFTTMVTVGYGDISGVSIGEKCYCMLLMFIGGTSYSLLTSYLTAMVQNEDEEQKLLVERLEILRSIKRDYKIDEKAYNRIQ